MQVDVRQERGDDPALWGSRVRGHDDPSARTPALSHLPIRPTTAVDHSDRGSPQLPCGPSCRRSSTRPHPGPSRPFRSHSARCQRVERMVGGPAWAEPVREVVEVPLVDGFQQHHHRTLQDLVRERRDPDGTGSPAPLRDLDPPHRRGPVGLDLAGRAGSGGSPPGRLRTRSLSLRRHRPPRPCGFDGTPRASSPDPGGGTASEWPSRHLSQPMWLSVLVSLRRYSASVPAIFPSYGSVFWRPLPSAFSLSVPRFHRYYGALRLLCSRPDGLRLPSSVRTHEGGAEASQVPGQPLGARPALDPGGIRLRPRPLECRWCLPRYEHVDSPVVLSGLIHAARALPVYASPRRSPDAAQHSVPAGGQPWPGGILTRGVA